MPPSRPSCSRRERVVCSRAAILGPVGFDKTQLYRAEAQVLAALSEVRGTFARGS